MRTLEDVLTVGIAALLVTASLTALAPPVSAHVVSGIKSYRLACDGFVVVCNLKKPDPTDGELCEEATCRFGGVVWDQGLRGEVTALHGYDGDGLDVRAEIHDDIGQAGDWGLLCIAQNTSQPDSEDGVCSIPAKEPARRFCGSSPWLEEVIKKPFESEDVDGDGASESLDWVAVSLGGSVTQAWSNRPDRPGPGPDPLKCNPLAAGATTGEVELFVRE